MENETQKELEELKKRVEALEKELSELLWLLRTEKGEVNVCPISMT